MSGSSSTTLFKELQKDSDRHHQYRDTLGDDLEASLDSLQETECGLLRDDDSNDFPQYNEKAGLPAETRRKSNSRCYAVIAAVLLLIVALGFFATMQLLPPGGASTVVISGEGVEDSEAVAKEEQPLAFSSQVLGPPTDSFWDNLRNDTQYMTGWFSAGWTNDFMTIVNMLYVAYLSNRTGVIPPFAPSHVSWTGGFPPFSEVFDLPRMAAEIERPLIEWQDVKRPDSPPDELGCWSVWATTKPEDDSPRTGPIPGYLNLDVSYTPVPRHAVPQDQHVRFAPLAAITFPDGRKHANLPHEAPYPSAGGHRQLPSEQMACFDFLYYASAVYPFEYNYDFSPAWRFIGTHAHWTSRIRSLTEDALASAFSLPDGSAIPPYISVHIRHGDFAGRCPSRGDANGTDSHLVCFAKLEKYADMVEEVKAELREKKGIEVDYVLVTSDEKSVAWWGQVRDLGWTWIDHKALNTEEKYGQWYPVFLDAAAQSLGAGFVGTRGSTMSLMAARRVVDWSGGVTRDVNGAPDATDRRRSLRPESDSEDDSLEVNGGQFTVGRYEFVV